MNRAGKYFALCGVALQAGLLLRRVALVVFLTRWFGAMQAPQDGTTAALAANAELIRTSTAVGQMLALAGILFLLVALFIARYEARWFTCALWAIAILWITAAGRNPSLCFFRWNIYGAFWTLLGFSLLIYLAANRRKRAREASGLKNAPYEDERTIESCGRKQP